jgi:carboxypeptidase C (cathepsin A)
LPIAMQALVAAAVAVLALSAPACTDAKMLTSRLFEAGSAHRPRSIANASYPVPSPSTSSALDMDPDSYAVHGLPNMPSDLFKTKHWAGEVPIPYAGVDNYGSIFFWLLEPADGKGADKPLVIWLNGGPGCSSMIGLFVENGPFRVQSNHSIGINPYSWHQEAYVLYIDQPLGYVGRCSSSSSSRS